MNELAPLLGKDLCMNFVALELAAFADDSTFRVRKVRVVFAVRFLGRTHRLGLCSAQATAQSFGNVCRTVGQAFTVAKLVSSASFLLRCFGPTLTFVLALQMPPYVKLSKDVIWGVRKGYATPSSALVAHNVCVQRCGVDGGCLRVGAARRAQFRLYAHVRALRERRKLLAAFIAFHR
jgi:hypothetical protein